MGGRLSWNVRIHTDLRVTSLTTSKPRGCQRLLATPLDFPVATGMLFSGFIPLCCSALAFSVNCRHIEKAEWLGSRDGNLSISHAALTQAPHPRHSSCTFVYLQEAPDSTRALYPSMHAPGHPPEDVPEHFTGARLNSALMSCREKLAEVLGPSAAAAAAALQIGNVQTPHARCAEQPSAGSLVRAQS